MIGKLARLTGGLAALAVAAMGTSAAQLQPGLMPEQGVLLLRNGQAIEGKITRAGQLYYVALANGEIRIKAADVELVCRDVEEGYHRKRAAMRSGSVGDHLELAEWCLRHGLSAQAGGELAAAARADPRHPMIGVLRRRLSLAVEPPKAPRPARPADSPPAASPEELARLVRGMPAGTVETFTGQIQPVLVNNCTGAGCHGPAAKTAFRLQRTPVGRPPGRLLTQRNLRATLQWVDKTNPSASRLLTAPIRPHGTARTAIFSHRQMAQYRRLVDWVHRVAQRPASEVPDTVVSPEQPAVRAMPAEPLDFDSPGPDSASRAGDRPGLLPHAKDPLAKPLPGRPVSPGGQFVPVDPFDPEIFNRRYFR